MNPIIKKDHVRVAGEHAPRPRRGHAKVASLVREGGEVRAIEFRCSCGEVVVLELEYGDVEAALPEPAPVVGEADVPTEEAA